MCRGGSCRRVVVVVVVVGVGGAEVGYRDRMY